MAVLPPLDKPCETEAAVFPLLPPKAAAVVEVAVDLSEVDEALAVVIGGAALCTEVTVT